jgi:hypothetical protein
MQRDTDQAYNNTDESEKEKKTNKKKKTGGKVGEGKRGSERMPTQHLEKDGKRIADVQVR